MLKPHQVVGVNWLFGAVHDGGGILADDPGLGKTLQMIMVLEALIRAQHARRILIVAPANLLANWASVRALRAQELAFEELRAGVALEDGLAYDEPWGWMSPVRHALGALLLEQVLACCWLLSACRVFFGSWRASMRSPPTVTA